MTAPKLSASPRTFEVSCRPEGPGRVVMELSDGARDWRLFFDAGEHLLQPGLEACLATVLVPAMASGAAVRLHGVARPGFSERLDALRSAYCRIHQELRPIQVTLVSPQPADVSHLEATEAPGLVCRAGRGEDRRVASFFSGGVDSFYTLLKHRQILTDLVLIYGFDIALDDHELLEKTSRMAHRVASELGKRLLEVRTNVRSFLDAQVDWGRLSHGPALAAVGLLLAPACPRLFIASSYALAQVGPWGSHPELDPLWSTDRTEFVHDGTEATRWQKTERIATWRLALESLRVCHQGRPGEYNCGRCESCLVLTIALKSLGVLGQCRTLPCEPDLRRVRRLFFPSSGRHFYAGELVGQMTAQGMLPEVRACLARALFRPRWEQSLLDSWAAFLRLVKRVATCSPWLWGQFQRLKWYVRG
ncbi:MAG: hypothetical protein HY814_03215 [Candidatus Riflebacteria bacterium]|nr:hypothetical protein [Candidatus Riflebacteria bacterium]